VVDNSEPILSCQYWEHQILEGWFYTPWSKISRSLIVRVGKNILIEHNWTSPNYWGYNVDTISNKYVKVMFKITRNGRLPPRFCRSFDYPQWLVGSSPASEFGHTLQPIHRQTFSNMCTRCTIKSITSTQKQDGWRMLKVWPLLWLHWHSVLWHVCKTSGHPADVGCPVGRLVDRIPTDRAWMIHSNYWIQAYFESDRSKEWWAPVANPLAYFKFGSPQFEAHG